jgi:hypothetical protein
MATIDREVQVDEVINTVNQCTVALLGGNLDRLVFQAVITGQNTKIKAIRTARDIGRDKREYLAAEAKPAKVKKPQAKRAA